MFLRHICPVAYRSIIMTFVDDAVGAGKDIVDKGEDGVDQAVGAAKGAIGDLVADNIEAVSTICFKTGVCSNTHPVDLQNHLLRLVSRIRRQVCQSVYRQTRCVAATRSVTLVCHTVKQLTASKAIAIIGILALLGVIFILYIIFASFKQLFKQGQCWCCVCCKHKLPDEVREKPKEHGLHLWGRWDSQWIKGVWRGVKDAAGVVSNAVRESGALERAAEAGTAVRKGAIAAGNTAYKNGRQATSAAQCRLHGGS